MIEFVESYAALGQDAQLVVTLIGGGAWALLMIGSLYFKAMPARERSVPGFVIPICFAVLLVLASVVFGLMTWVIWQFGMQDPMRINWRSHKGGFSPVAEAVLWGIGGVGLAWSAVGLVGSHFGEAMRRWRSGE